MQCSKFRLYGTENAAVCSPIGHCETLQCGFRLLCAEALNAIFLSLILIQEAAADEVLGVVSTGAAAIYLPDSCTTNCSALQVSP